MKMQGRKQAEFNNKNLISVLCARYALAEVAVVLCLMSTHSRFKFSVGVKLVATIRFQCRNSAYAYACLLASACFFACK